MARMGPGSGRRPNAAMLRLSHCQTALLGKRGGGSGGGGRVLGSHPRDECSEPAGQAWRLKFLRKASRHAEINYLLTEVDQTHIQCASKVV